jgi:hypothetical protein
VAFTGRLVGWCAGAGVESYAARVRSGTRGSGQRGGRGVAGGGVLLLQCCCVGEAKGGVVGSGGYLPATAAHSLSVGASGE